MRRWINLALFALVCALPLGCRPQPAPPKLIYNIPGPEVPLYHSSWELFEHRFPMALTPDEAVPLLHNLGYRFLKPEEGPLAQQFTWTQSRIGGLSLGFLYLNHPIVVFFQPEGTDNIYIMGFDQGIMPRQMRGFYEEAELGEEYGWLVMREKPTTY